MASDPSTLGTFPITFNGQLTGAVDINAAFTLGSGYLVGPFITITIISSTLNSVTTAASVMILRWPSKYKLQIVSVIQKDSLLIIRSPISAIHSRTV